MKHNSLVRGARYLLPLFLISLLSACGGSDTNIVERDPVNNPDPVDPPVEHHSGARLLVTQPGAHDHVLVFDLEEKTELANLHVEGNISGLYASPNNRYGIAVQGNAGIVNFIDSGVEWETHGDHGHLHLSEPAMVDFQMAGTKPAHVTKHEDQIVIFFDGAEGTPAEIRIVTESGIADGATLAEYSDNINQHGAAQAWGEYLIATARDGNITPATTLPSMVRVSERHGDHFHELELFDAPEHACTGLHGSAQNVGFVTFGCTDGVLVIEPHDDHFHAHKIAHDTRISSLYGHPNVIDFVGTGRNSNEEPVALFAVSPATETITAISYDRTPRAYSFAEDGEVFLILDTEGGLTALDTHDWSVVGERIQVTAAAEGEGQVFRLTLSDDGETAYIADVGAQEILVVDIHEWAIDNDATIELDFAPGPILWVGTSNEEGEHDH
ncbi:hypothetical protein ACSV5M_05215 [Cellvibrio sp. ARAG 10.3]|uniref:hypothetical protein n=1 Tax=Cellvibrio sp. ARAG 10.3 TaxID=3451358 RepID=UPI003F479CB5